VQVLRTSSTDPLYRTSAFFVMHHPVVHEPGEQSAQPDEYQHQNHHSDHEARHRLAALSTARVGGRRSTQAMLVGVGASDVSLERPASGRDIGASRADLHGEELHHLRDVTPANDRRDSVGPAGGGRHEVRDHHHPTP